MSTHRCTSFLSLPGCYARSEVYRSIISLITRFRMTGIETIRNACFGKAYCEELPFSQALVRQIFQCPSAC